MPRAGPAAARAGPGGRLARRTVTAAVAGHGFSSSQGHGLLMTVTLVFNAGGPGRVGPGGHHDLNGGSCTGMQD